MPARAVAARTGGMCVCVVSDPVCCLFSAAPRKRKSASRNRLLKLLRHKRSGFSVGRITLTRVTRRSLRAATATAATRASSGSLSYRVPRSRNRFSSKYAIWCSLVFFRMLDVQLSACSTCLMCNCLPALLVWILCLRLTILFYFILGLLWAPPSRSSVQRRLRLLPSASLSSLVTQQGLLDLFFVHCPFHRFEIGCSGGFSTQKSKLQCVTTVISIFTSLLIVHLLHLPSLLRLTTQNLFVLYR